MLKILTNRLSENNIATWKFPCGEVGVDVSNAIISDCVINDFYHVVMEYENDSDIMALCQVVDALRVQSPSIGIKLYMPYLPYSRQDRRCKPGEGHALKVFANIINSLNLAEVRTDDAHSYVAEAVFNNFRNVPQEECARCLPIFDFLIAPDDGASKKIYKHTQVKLGAKVIVAAKTRDSMGKVSYSNSLPDGHLIEGKDVCIVDDLCDGGATFIQLSNVLEQYKPANISLYVTHGMFTKPENFELMRSKFKDIFVYNLGPIAQRLYSDAVKLISIH